MSDLISRSALLKSYDIAKMVEYDETGCGVTRIAIPVQAIKDAPTIDAVPVVHARWIEHVNVDEFGDCCYIDQECSHCHVIELFVDDGVRAFCPNCGAKMDGGVDRE